jgi:hypothetical protein
MEIKIIGKGKNDGKKWNLEVTTTKKVKRRKRACMERG